MHADFYTHAMLLGPSSKKFTECTCAKRLDLKTGEENHKMHKQDWIPKINSKDMHPYPLQIYKIIWMRRSIFQITVNFQSMKHVISPK